VIKSFPKGIRVNLSDEPDFETILEETRQSFREAASFFDKASVALQFQGRDLTEEETDRLLAAIREVCNLHIICLVCTDEKANDYFSRLLEAPGTKHEEPRQGCQFYRGSLQDGEIFEASSGIIILGSVQRGAAVLAKGNIIVLGELLGTAQAGTDGNTDCFIAALVLDAENLRIGNLRYRKAFKERLGKSRKHPRMVTASGDTLMIREIDFTKELPEL
jgi:septum site-determining protein MinC